MNCKVTNFFSYIMYKSIVCCLAYLCKFNCKDNFRHGQKSGTPDSLILNIGRFCDFSHKTPLILMLNASRYGNLCTSAPSLAALGIAGTSPALLSLAQTVSQPLQNPRCRESITFPVRKFLRSDAEGIKCVGAVGAELKEVFLCLGKSFAAFVLSEAVAAAAHAGCLDCEDKVIVGLRNGIRRCFPAKPWLMSGYFSSCRMGLPRQTASTVQPCRSNS